MVTTEMRAEINQMVEMSTIDRWPKTIKGFLTVIKDGKNPLFEEIARVIEGPGCHRALVQYLVSDGNGREFCPISRRPREARAWVGKMRERRKARQAIEQVVEGRPVEFV